MTSNRSTFRDIAAMHQTPALLIGTLAVVSLLVMLSGSQSAAVSLAEMLIQIIVVVGLYIFIGNSGVMSFGHIGFMCIGAYVAAWATVDPTFKQIMLSGLPTVLQDNQFSFGVAVAGGAVLAAVVALAFGAAIMRLSGIACSIATFAFLMIVNSVYSNWDSVTAGVSPIIGVPTVVDPWIALVFAAVSIVIAYLFQVSRYGVILRATREDEVAAKACAVDIVRVRLIAFVISALVVGGGGALYAQFLGIVSVDAFYLDMSFITIAMLVVGGIGSLTGAVSGVLVVTLLIQILRVLERGDLGFTIPQGSQELGLGIVMALVLVLRAQGLTNGREIRLPSKAATNSERPRPNEPAATSDFA